MLTDKPQIFVLCNCAVGQVPQGPQLVLDTRRSNKMRRTKIGSSRRKGDEYQDLTALQLVLESYIDGRDFQVFIEYEKAGSLDDVVVVFPGGVDVYQIKHAVSDNAVYVADDLTNPDSVVFVEKFAKSWKKLATEFPSRQLTLYLRSNRALDAHLAEVVTGTASSMTSFARTAIGKKNANFVRLSSSQQDCQSRSFSSSSPCFISI